MERKFTFDDMKFVARSERVEGTFQIGIYDAFDECRHEAEYPAGLKSKRKVKAGTVPRSDEETAIDAAIEDFKHQVEDGEIDLA